MNETLRSALTDFYLEAVSFLRARLTESVPDQYQTSRWHDVESEMLDKFRLAHGVLERRLWKPEVREELTSLRSWRIAKSILLEDPTVTGGGVLSAESYLRQFVPTPEEVEQGGYERLGVLLDHMTHPQGQYQTVWPIPGLCLGGDPVQLEADLELGPMRADEIAVAMTKGMLEYDYVYRDGNGFLFADMERSDAPCCLRYQGKANLMGEDSLDRLLLETIEEVLLLAFTITLPIAGCFQGSKHPLMGDDSGLYAVFRPGKMMRFPTKVGTDELELRQKIRDLWTQICAIRTSRKHAGLRLALRRMRFQSARERPEDEILDLMIAAEAFYLSDSGKSEYRGELRYRLSLRTAVFADLVDLEISGKHLPDNIQTILKSRIAISKLMRSAYDHRSAIAHGSTAVADPWVRTIAVGKYSHISLTELVQGVRVLLASACRTALGITASGSPWPLADWDLLVIND